MIKNNGKSLFKISFAIISLFVLLFVNIVSISASATAPSSIELGPVLEFLSPYVSGGPKFPIKAMKDKTVVYCLNHQKDIARNVTEYKVEEMDAAIAYIIKNGYPNKSITGDRNKDYYITQVAIWWYLDEVKGTKNNASSFYSAENTGLKLEIYNLKEAAKKNKAYATTTLKINTVDENFKLSEDGKFYVTSNISVNSTNIDKFKVSISGIRGALVKDINGEVRDLFNKGESFVISVPSEIVTVGNHDLTVNVSATGTVDKAYEYKPNNTNIQPVVPGVLYTETIDVNDKKVFKLTKEEVVEEKITGIYVSKRDITNDQELPGATLVIKDSEGNVIEEWVSTNEPHYFDELKPGIYTLTETVAPSGYILNTESITFEVTEGKINTVIMLNAPEIVVPITDANIPLFVYVIAFSGIIIGSALVYKKVKVS